MKFGSVCSGIEAASVAWSVLGWEASWFSEIEPFPSAVLAHHYPNVPNLGDMRVLPNRILLGEIEAPDILCGGTPCQAFSVAGKRQSLDDVRGNLSLTFCEIANAIDFRRSLTGVAPSIIFWENVPGVLNTKDNAFGCFLGALAGEDCALEPSGKKWTNAGAVFGPQRAIAWRTLDAQYFGLAQRRRRVFVVASARDGFDPAAVLFEFDGLRRDIAPRREAPKEVTEIAGTITANAGGLNRPGGNANELDFCVVGHRMQNFGQYESDETASTVKARDYKDATDLVTYALAGNTIDRKPENGTGYDDTGACYTLTATDRNAVTQHPSVRRLLPVECERLQGFPDNYTNIPWRNKPDAPDGHRYKALGNSWAVPVVRWIGERVTEQLRTSNART